MWHSAWGEQSCNYTSFLSVQYNTSSLHSLLSVLLPCDFTERHCHESDNLKLHHTTLTYGRVSLWKQPLATRHVRGVGLGSCVTSAHIFNHLQAAGLVLLKAVMNLRKFWTTTHVKVVCAESFTDRQTGQTGQRCFCLNVLRASLFPPWPLLSDNWRIRVVLFISHGFHEKPSLLTPQQTWINIILNANQ